MFSFILLLILSIIGILFVVYVFVDTDNICDKIISVVFLFCIIFYIIYGSNTLKTEISKEAIEKYIKKEIVIDEMNIIYDSQNKPIDTTYTFKSIK